MEPLTGPFAPAPAALPPVSEPNELFSAESFLALLAAQLRGQNPMDPMSDTEFVAQMAQFSQLEQTTAMRLRIDELALSGRLSQAASLLGRTVDYRVADDGAIRSGTVERLIVAPAGRTTLIVDGASVELDAIAGVR